MSKKNTTRLIFFFSIAFFIHCGEATKTLNKCEEKCGIELSLCAIVIGNNQTNYITESSSGAVESKTTNSINPVGVYLCYIMNNTCKSSCYKSSSNSTPRTTSSSRSSSSSSSGGGGSASGGGAGS
ncbi:MAG: hypothetical protein L6Q54_02340 [Leptospiraceae bacterium]|nr:hypothetical protein [Leptospiraceae bacterium]MCK6380078.1 hypothetical protein [Leptospiraceae bacterium]NUM40481.1 hypothetical protein [Leptospiraceae bacterium]